MERIGRSSDNKEKTVEIDVLSLVSVALIVMMGVLLLFGLFDFAKYYLKVSKFEISGITDYEASELAGAAGIKKGDRLYGVDTDDAEAKILEQFSYLESVKIKRMFPNKVRFVVESRSPVWYIEITGDYYVLDASMRVLEQTKNVEHLRAAGITRLDIPSPNNVIEGEIITYGDGAGETEQTKKIMNTILSSSIKSRLTEVNITNRFDIHFVIDGKFDVDIGRYENLEIKLQTLYNTLQLQKDEAERAVGGTISITSTGDRCVTRFKYSGGEESADSSVSG